MRGVGTLRFAAIVCLCAAAQAQTPVQWESTTGLGPATAMTSDASGALYIAGPATNGFGQAVPVRTPPNGVTSLVADGAPAAGFVARVRSAGHP